jgi:hypothetical protein
MATLLTVFIGAAAFALLTSGLLRKKEAWDTDDRAWRLPLLRRRREQLLRAIKDLDLQGQAGAGAEEAPMSQRSRLKSEAIAVSKELDRLRKARLRALVKSGQRGIQEQAHRVEEAVRLRRAALREAELRGACRPGEGRAAFGTGGSP